MKWCTPLWGAALIAGILAAAVARANDLPVGATDVGTKIFLDATHRDQDVNGQRTADSGTGVDLKRFFVNVDHRFSDIWSAHVTADIHWERHRDPTDLWFRYAYGQARFSKALKLRLGSAPMPWQGLVNKWSGHRYVEKDLTMRGGVGNPADWGAHLLGSLGANGRLQYQASVVTGAGYKKPRLGNGPDVAARVSFQPSAHTVVGVGGYRGTLGKNINGRHARHKARRLSLMAAWANQQWRLGGQYFRARDWTRVVRAASDRSHGWSLWASVQLSPVLALFARHDHVEPSRRLDSDQRERYSHVGVEWKTSRWLRLAAVFKRERLKDHDQRLRKVNEVGVWAQVTF
jgi:hypothetical protein